MAERKLSPERALYALVGVVLLLLGCSWFYVTFIVSEETKVRWVIAEVMESAEARNPRAVSSLFSDDFKAKYRTTTVDKNEAHSALVRLFMVEYKFGFRVTIDPEDFPVELAEDGKTALVRYKLSAKGQTSRDGPWVDLRQREAKGATHQLTLRKTDEGWRLHRLTFKFGK